jgi:hypothetical protein
MPTNNKKVVFYATDAITRWIAEQHELYGSSNSEIIRRACNLAAFGDAQTLRERMKSPVLIHQARKESE